jgi:uncharacterized membrane protein
MTDSPPATAKTTALDDKPVATPPPTPSPAPPPPPTPGSVWAYGGMSFGPSEFANSMIHFYRAEVSRANVWRTRLDATTNWAVIITAATLSLVFGSTASNLHVMIPIATLMVTLFVIIEARRYRYYELWALRVRMMEINYFAAMLAPPHQPAADWASGLVDSLLHPKYPISTWEAFGRRFRRNYQYIYALLAIAWVNKIALHPTPVATVGEFLSHARIGLVPGGFVLSTGLLFYAGLFAIGWLTVGLRKSRGEVFDETGLRTPYELLQSAGSTIQKGIAMPRRHEQLGHIITSKGDEVAQQIMQTFNRGVTSLPGKGMYSGEDRSVLMVAVDPNQAGYLKQAVYSIDPAAFVIILGTEHVIGEGFEAPS